MRNIVAAPIPPELAERALRMVARLRAGSGDHEEVVQTVGQMTEAVLRHFFLEPMDAIQVGHSLRRAVELGVNGAVRGLNFGLKRIIPRLREPQLRQLAEFIDRSLLEAPKP